MKIALVTDTHFGARQDNLQFDAYFEQFYTDFFFPYLQEHGIKTICHLGDIFDRRKYINFNTLKSCKRYFFAKAAELGIEIHMIPGNHDTYFKNTNDVNSPNLLLGEYDNITLYEEPTEIMLDRHKVLYLPWICGENYDRTMAKIKESDAKTVFGHFEFAGYDMLPGMPNLHGMDPNTFDGYDLVVSGHFHHRHSRGNITYMGNPYEITWSDYDDPRGFALFDTVEGSLEYHDNPFRIFHKIYYDDSTFEGVNDIRNYDFNPIIGGVVKLIVTKKTDYKLFDSFVDKLYLNNLLDLKIIEDFSEFEDEALGDDINLEDTMTLLKEYVDVVETDLDKQKIKNLLQTLYLEAQDTI
jgi:DNA repair exonuclease SbcCD nuclease subunit